MESYAYRFRCRPAVLRRSLVILIAYVSSSTDWRYLKLKIFLRPISRQGSRPFYVHQWLQIIISTLSYNVMSTVKVRSNQLITEEIVASLGVTGYVPFTASYSCLRSLWFIQKSIRLYKDNTVRKILLRP